MRRCTLVCLILLGLPLLHAQEQGALLQTLERMLGPGHDQVASLGAADSYAALLGKLRPSDRPRLVAVARAYASKRRPGATALTLDLLADELARDGARQVGVLRDLLEIEPFGLEGVVEVYAALPWSASSAGLTSELCATTPRVRARAARLLAEVAPLKSAGAVVAEIAPLASDASPQVRLAFVQALRILQADLAPVASSVAALASDTVWGVAAAALRLSGARGLAAVLPGARELAQSSKAHAEVRLEAMIALARLGDAEQDVPVLRGLLEASWLDAIGRSTALWCLATLDPAGATPLVELAIDADPHDPSLYLALPRLGQAGARLVRQNLSLDRSAAAIPQSELYERRVFTLQALAAGPCHAAVVDALYAFCMQEPASKPTSLGPNHEEFALAVRAISLQRSEHARETLARLMLKRRNEQQVLALVPEFAQLGAPAKDRGLARQLSQELAGLYGQNLEMRAGLGRALSRVDPAVARILLTKTLDAGGDGPEARQTWTRLLARAGDPGPLRQKSLPLSRQALSDAEEGARRSALFWLGLDELSALHYGVALRVFRQVNRARPGPSAAYNCACALSLLGDPEGALRWLRRARRLGYSDAFHMWVDADLRPLAPLGRFRRLARSLELSREIDCGLPDTTWPE